MEFPHQLPTVCDLSETGLDEARVRLGAPRLSDLSVYCGERNGMVARRLQGRYGFKLCVFPDALLLTCQTWGVNYAGRLVWTPGVT